MKLSKKRTLQILYIALIISILITVRFGATYYQQSRYVRGVYDCTDMSKDCEEFFESIGIRTQVLYGFNGGGHCWLRLHTIFGVYEFESTQLTFMNVSENWYNIVVTEGWIE